MLPANAVGNFRRTKIISHMVGRKKSRGTATVSTMSISAQAELSWVFPVQVSWKTFRQVGKSVLPEKVELHIITIAPQVRHDVATRLMTKLWTCLWVGKG